MNFKIVYKIASSVICLLIPLSGCQTPLTREKIEGDISAAISNGMPAKTIQQLVLQSENPSEMANYGIRRVMQLKNLPRKIESCWGYDQPKPTKQTPGIEVTQVLNQEVSRVLNQEVIQLLNCYRYSIISVLFQQGGDLNQKDEDGVPCIRFTEGSPITPELLAWLLNSGYDANITDETNPNYSALGFCARPGQAVLSYDQKYTMIKLLLTHGANPNTTSLGRPILHTLITSHKHNPYLFDMIDLLLEAGADVNRVDQNNRTPLDLAYLYMIEQVNDNKEDTKRELIELLTYYGAKRAAKL